METEIRCTQVTDTVKLSIFPIHHEAGDTMRCPRQNPQDLSCNGCVPGYPILIKELDYDKDPNILVLDPEASNIPAWDVPTN